MSKRTLKYKTIAKSEEAPVVGSVVEEKDTIFVKQVSATEFEVFVSDETGYVVKLDKTIDRVSFDQMVKAYIVENIMDFKNLLNFTPARFFDLRGGLYTGLSFIFYHNGERKEITRNELSVLETSNRKYFYRENDTLVMKGTDYPDRYITFQKGILGKNLTEEHTIVYEEENSDNTYLEPNIYDLYPVNYEALIEKHSFTCLKLINPDGGGMGSSQPFSVENTLRDGNTFYTKKMKEDTRTDIYSVDGNVVFNIRGNNGDTLEIVSSDEEVLYSTEISEEYVEIPVDKIVNKEVSFRVK